MNQEQKTKMENGKKRMVHVLETRSGFEIRDSLLNNIIEAFFNNETGSGLAQLRTRLDENNYHVTYWRNIDGTELK